MRLGVPIRASDSPAAKCDQILALFTPNALEHDAPLMRLRKVVINVSVARVSVSL